MRMLSSWVRRCSAVAPSSTRLPRRQRSGPPTCRGKVVAVGEGPQPPPDSTTVDVRGAIVGPGFVALHRHVHSIAGQRLQAMDGVTTALDLEAGVMPLARAYAEAAAQGRPLNYGFSAS